MKRGHFIAATAAVVVASPLLPLETTEVVSIDPSLLVDESIDRMLVRYQAVGGALSMKLLEEVWMSMAQYVIDENGDRVIAGPRRY